MYKDNTSLNDTSKCSSTTTLAPTTSSNLKLSSPSTSSNSNLTGTHSLIPTTIENIGNRLSTESIGIPSTSGLSPASDDIQLINDIGYIADKVRLLDDKFSNCNESIGPYAYHQDAIRSKVTKRKSIQKVLNKLQENTNKISHSDKKEIKPTESLGDSLTKSSNAPDDEDDDDDDDTITAGARKEILEDLLIKFYKAQELVKGANKQQHELSANQVQFKPLENYHIMSCSSIEKLVGIDEKYSIKHLHRKQSSPNPKTTSLGLLIDANATANINNIPDPASKSPLGIIKKENNNLYGRKYSVGAVLTSSGINHNNDSNKLFCGDDNLLGSKINKKSTIILSKSSGNVHFNIDDDVKKIIKPDKLNKSNTYLNNDNNDIISSINSLTGNKSEETNSESCACGVTTTTSSTIEYQKINKSRSGSNSSCNNYDFNFIQLKNTIIQCQFNTDDLKAVVGALKKKIEYTEKMNWLSLSRRPIGAPERKSSLPKHTDVKKRFLEICDTTLTDDIKSALRLPAFDSYDWEDADVIHLMQTMFIELGLVEKFNIPLDILREWLYEVYKHYNEVPFHNFRHCFCVAQMMYAISQQANLCKRLGELEVLILLVSCICHDLDHPGYNNIYQINARTELALRYNDISPLENHHCSIAFRLLEHPDCNIFKYFNRETFNVIREGIIRCILATDMARHNEILTQFKEISPIFDYSNRAHINLLCMVLIKVADISNEARPMDVAEPWLDRLLQEFFAQSAAEKSEGLPVTPFMDPDKISKPGSQVRFIGLVLLPLFEALGDLLPELIDLIIIPVRVALDYYKRLNDAQQKTRKSFAETASVNTQATNYNDNSSDNGGSISPQMRRSQSGISVKSKRSIPSQKSTSRTSVDEPQCVTAELQDLPEGSESGDSETATEVDVAEKASKFKVDTESSNRSKSSHSTSRKSSREKRPSMISEMCSSGGRIRNSYGNIHGYHSNRNHFGSNRAVSLDQYSNNRRLSTDGLQQVISDSNVFYNRHNRSIDTEGQSHLNTGSATTPIDMKPKVSEPLQQPNTYGEDLVNMNTNPSTLYYDLAVKNMQNPTATSLMQQNKKNPTTGFSSSSNSSGQNCSSSAKSWRARFKQITDNIFSFSFDKNSKTFGSTRSTPCSIRNNNATTELTKPGICCTITNNLSPNLKPHQQQRQQELINAGRNRAYSLDVPCTKYRYSNSSSGGGDSRKSSKNDDNSNRNDCFNEDNNSNNTSIGEVPPIRINGGDAPELLLTTNSQQQQSLPRVLTPSIGDGGNNSIMEHSDYEISGTSGNQQKI